MLDAFIRASVGGGIAVCLVWTLCRLLPALPPAVRAALWWCAAAKFLLALAWIAPLRLPLLPETPAALASYVISATGIDGRRMVPLERSVESSAGTADVADARMQGGTSPSTAWPMPVAAALFIAWSVGVAGVCAAAAHRWRRTAQVVRASTTAPADVQSLTGGLAATLGLGRVPLARFSSTITTPLVSGLRRPVVVLPDGGGLTLSPDELRMAICHELTHLRRHDLLLGCVPALVERLFFFHPLAHAAAREYSLWREAACDASVVEVLGISPQQYGKFLLTLGVSRTGGPSAAKASWSFAQLKRRLMMLGNPLLDSRKSRFAALAAVGAVTMVMLPLQVVARPDSDHVQILPGPSTSLSGSGVDAERLAAVPQSESSLSFVLLEDDNHSMTHGRTEDFDRARRLRRADERLLWFRLDGREYVVRGGGAIAEIKMLWQPVNDLGMAQGRLGEQQGELGRRQGELGERQGELGAHQGRLGDRQADLGNQMARLAERRARSSREGDRAAFDREQQRLEVQMDELNSAMRTLQLHMQKLNEPMQDLNGPMRELGDQMEVMGRQMDLASSRATRDTRAALTRFVSNGVATPAP